MPSFIWCNECLVSVTKYTPISYLCSNTVLQCSVKFNYSIFFKSYMLHSPKAPIFSASLLKCRKITGQLALNQIRIFTFRIRVRHSAQHKFCKMLLQSYVTRLPPVPAAATRINGNGVVHYVDVSLPV